MAEVTINQDSPPAFTVDLGEGRTHSVDPLEVVSKFRAAGVYNSAGEIDTNDDQAVVAVREAFELPSLTYTSALLVFDAFHRWFTGEFQKKMGWSKTSLTNTASKRSDSATPTDSDCGDELEPVGPSESSN